MRGLAIMRELGWPVVFDATHSVQLPGGAGAASGGQPRVHRTAGAGGRGAGVDGVFVEVHDAPEHALSDGANSLRLDRLAAFWSSVRGVDATSRAAAIEATNGDFAVIRER